MPRFELGGKVPSMCSVFPRDVSRLYYTLEQVSLTSQSMSSPGPSDVDSALWAAIFSDAITLVRSDRFYTVVGAALQLNWEYRDTNMTRTGTQIL